MTSKTTIEWTAQPGYVGAVWNPTTGCTRVSAGCDNCYAFALHDKRYKANLDHARTYGHKTTTAFRESFEYGAESGDTVSVADAPPFPKQYDLPFSRVQLLEDRLDVPLRTRKPTCYFVDSMADLFHEDVRDDFLDGVFHTMEQAPRHRFLILTKRPQRMRRWMTFTGEALKAFRDEPFDWPPKNVWLGTSVEDQRAADERIPHLLATPAAVRFLSCEPMLGPLNLTRYMPRPGEAVIVCPSCKNERWYGPGNCGKCDAPSVRAIDWVIAGGESGPRARPFDLAWPRSLRDQCAAAGVSYFVKQLGSKPMTRGFMLRGTSPDALTPDGTPPWGSMRESHGRDTDEWPADLRVREFPR